METWCHWLLLCGTFYELSPSIAITYLVFKPAAVHQAFVILLPGIVHPEGLIF